MTFFLQRHGGACALSYDRELRTTVRRQSEIQDSEMTFQTQVQNVTTFESEKVRE